MRKAMVLAAGLGTRLRPLTDNKPKALVEAGGKTLLEHTLLKLKEAGFGFIVVNVHHFAWQITEFLRTNDNFGLHVEISDESGMLLDTGGAIKKACPLFEGSPFLIHNVDIMSNADLAALYDEQSTRNAAALLLVSKRESSRKLLFAGDGRLCGWRNETTGETKLPWGNKTPGLTQDFAFSGIHVFSPSLYGRMAKYPDKFSIIDFYLDACKEETVYASIHDKLKLLDVGKPDTLHSPLVEEFYLHGKTTG